MRLRIVIKLTFALYGLFPAILLGGSGNCFWGSFGGSLTGNLVGNAISRPRQERREVQEVRVVEQRPVIVQQIPAAQPVNNRSPIRQSYRDPRLDANTTHIQTELDQMKEDLEQLKARNIETEGIVKEYRLMVKTLQDENMALKSKINK